MDRRSTSHRSALGLALALLAAGCTPDDRALHGYAVTAPAGWEPWSGAPLTVPGDILEAYRVPTSSAAGSFVVFRSTFLPRTTVDELLTQRKFLLTNLPSLRIDALRAITVDGKPAAFVDLVADGTGDALLPTGLGKPLLPAARAADPTMPTRRRWVIVPRGPDLGTLEVLFHCPDNERPAVEDAWAAALASLRVTAARD